MGGASPRGDVGAVQAVMSGADMNDIRVLMVGLGSDCAELWVDGLRGAGAHLTQIEEGVDLLAQLGPVDPDVVLVDLGLGGALDAFETCRAIRAHSDVVVVLVAEEGRALDEVVALAVGADHFFVADTPVDVVVARLRALRRRATGLVRPGSVAGPDGPVDRCVHEATHRAASGPLLPSSNGHLASASVPPSGPVPGGRRSDADAVAGRIVDGDLVIDLAAREVRVAGSPVRLTRIEFDLLATLAHQPRRVFTHEQLLESVWDDPFDGSHVLTTHMSRLRCKMAAAGGGRVGYAVRGVGYRLRG